MPRPIREVPVVDVKFIEQRTSPEPNTGCWLWVGAPNSSGYAQVSVDGRKVTAHRLSYVAHHGPIVATVELDHRCRQRGCVNPDHLEPVAPRVNWERGHSPSRLNARKTHCRRGHLLSPDNIYLRPRSTKAAPRECLACKYDRERVHQQYLAKCQPGKSRHRPTK